MVINTILMKPLFYLDLGVFNFGLLELSPLISRYSLKRFTSQGHTEHPLIAGVLTWHDPEWFHSGV